MSEVNEILDLIENTEIFIEKAPEPARGIMKKRLSRARIQYDALSLKLETVQGLLGAITGRGYDFYLSDDYGMYTCKFCGMDYHRAPNSMRHDNNYPQNLPQLPDDNKCTNPSCPTVRARAHLAGKPVTDWHKLAVELARALEELSKACFRFKPENWDDPGFITAYREGIFCQLAHITVVLTNALEADLLEKVE